MPISCIFVGSYPMSLAVLEALARDEKFSVQVVVTSPEIKSDGTTFQNRVAEWMRANRPDIPMLFPRESREIEALLRERGIRSVDFVLSCAFPLKITNQVRLLAGVEALNIHPSLLPRHRGADPVRRAILDGSPETGVTIHRLVDEFDAGPVFGSKRLAVDLRVHLDELTRCLSRAAAELALDMLPKIEAGLQPIPQDPAQATHAPGVPEEERWLSLARPVEELQRKIRGLYPWRPALLRLDGRVFNVGPVTGFDQVQGGTQGFRLAQNLLSVVDEKYTLTAKIEKVE